MRPSPQLESSSSSPPRPLPSALSNALASLDIQLEEELMRYRRLRGGTGNTGRPENRNRAFKSKSLDLISVPAPAGEARPIEAPSSQFSVEQQPDARATTDPSNAESVAVGPSVPSAPSHPSAFVANSHSSNLAIAVPVPESQLAADNETENASLSTATEDDRGSLVPPLNHRLDDYLESSEELLRSLATEEAGVQAERGFMRSLLTPLGVGSMLLLLISSAMFGYVVMNPSSLVRLFAFRNSNHAPSSSDPANPAQTAIAPPQPNLANQEFKDLNLGTLGTLKADHSAAAKKTSNSGASATLPAKPTVTSTRLGASGSSTSAATPNLPGGSPSASSAALAPTRSSVPTVSAPAQYAPPVRVVDPPQPARISPSSGHSNYNPGTTSSRTSYSSSSKSPVSPGTNGNGSRVSVPSTPANSARGSGAGTNGYGYKVVTDFDGDRTLESVKQVVPPAYVRNYPDGRARIQMGAYTSATEAEKQAQQLRNQGIPAKVYQP